MKHGRKAGFINTAVVGERVPLTRERLRLYPLFSEEFLEWLFQRIDPSCSPIYTAHFWMEKPR
ncbi:MAG: hypothetical protein ACYDAB_17410 [bacterium]